MLEVWQKVPCGEEAHISHQLCCPLPKVSEQEGDLELLFCTTPTSKGAEARITCTFRSADEGMLA